MSWQRHTVTTHSSINASLNVTTLTRWCNRVVPHLRARSVAAAGNGRPAPETRPTACKHEETPISIQCGSKSLSFEPVSRCDA